MWLNIEELMTFLKPPYAYPHFMCEFHFITCVVLKKTLNK